MKLIRFIVGILFCLCFNVGFAEYQLQGDPSGGSYGGQGDAGWNNDGYWHISSGGQGQFAQGPVTFHYKWVGGAPRPKTVILAKYVNVAVSGYCPVPQIPSPCDDRIRPW